MAIALSTQLESLERERQRLEELLMLDANWRALLQLEERVAAGEPLSSVDGPGVRTGLEQALKANRIYVARAKLIETIELLSAGSAGASAASGGLAGRIVMLSEPTGERFRARLRMKPIEVREADKAAETVPEAAPPRAAIVQPRAPQSSDPKPAVPDALMLIAGLGARAVELLHDGGVTRFEQIAGWSSVVAAGWRSRLAGVADGTTGSWIEQAAVLAQGHQTRFSARVRRGEYAALVPPPGVEPPRPAAGVAVERSVEAVVGSRGPSAANPSSANGPGLAEPVPTPGKRRLKTAEEIAQALAAREAFIGKPAVRSPDEPAQTPASHGTADSAEPVRRGPYSRPRRGAGGTDGVGESDVTVVARGGGAKRSLLGRLKDIADKQRFEAGTYAAYRGSVEEASVTIVRSLTSEAGEPAGKVAASAAPAGSAAQLKSKRFLKALTGRE